MLTTFDPTKYNVPENQFFLEHLGESPIVALDDPLPKGVNPVVVKKVLGTVYEYEELKKHKDTWWIGIEAIKTAIKTYLREDARWREMAQRGLPRYPSRYTWDAKGRPHRGGTGSDSKLAHWIDDEGKRHKLAIDLVHPTVAAFQPKWVKPDTPLPEDFIDDPKKGKLECPLCGWVTQYNPDSRSTYNVARARAAAHCKQARKEAELHREFGTVVFGG